MNPSRVERSLTYRGWLLWLRVIRHLVPGEHREAWFAEWHGELWEAQARDAEVSPARLGRRMLGALPHALFLLRSEWRLWMLTQDLRYAFRVIGRAPGFAVLVIGTLAIGIGASTAMFTLVRSVLLRPMPFPEPESLVYMYGSFSQYDRAGISPPDFLDYRERNRSFESFAARTVGGRAILTGEGGAERVSAPSVTANFFATLGVTPILGRTFVPEEEEGGGHEVVVLSNALWQRRFGASRDVIGETMQVDGRATEIVGVMPSLLDQMFDVDLWRPLAFHTPETSVRRFHFLRAVGRLEHGVTLEQAQADINAIAQQLEAVYPENETWTLRLLPYRQAVVGDVAPALLMLLAAVTLVLLIACGNVASLLLARATAREGEIAVRSAMGASRSRVIRQLLTESLVLGLAGGAAGLLIALLLVRGVRTLATGFLPRLSEVAVDPVVLLFTVAVSLLTGVLFGLAPAMHASKRSLNSTLQALARTSGTRTGLRVRDALVVVQVALSLVLLVAAGLLGQTLLRLQEVDPGFDSRNMLVADLQATGDRYSSREEQTRFWSELLGHVRAIPGVGSASATSLLPLAGGGDTYYWLEGNPPVRDADRRNAQITVVADRYFETMDIPLVRGRLFREVERNGPNVMIINEGMAARLFPDDDPVGKRLVVDFGEAFTAEVVGVVGDVLAFGLQASAPDMMYFAHDQGAGFSREHMNLVVRSVGEPLELVPALRTRLAALDRDVPLSNARTMDAVVGGTVASERFGARLLVSFAVIALGLAVIGLYGVLGYVVAQRTRELGIRLALGARRAEVFALVIRRGMTIVLLGLTLGIIAALGTSHLLEGLLFDISARDPAVFAIVPVVLVLAGLLACALPARRATRVNPVHALKGD